jgi:tight adherence protein B
VDKVLEYAFIISLFIVFGSLAALATLLYARYFGPEAKMLRSRLKQIEGLRKADGLGAGYAFDKAQKPNPMQDFLERIGRSEYLNNLILRSAAKITPIEIIGIAAGMAGLGLLFSFFTPDNVLGVVLSILLPIILAASPFVVLNFKASRRKKRFDEKFPEALGLMARALQAGSGLTSALGMVANELPDPCGTEFKKAFDEINFGISFNAAITNMVSRVQSQDLDFFVTALLIQRETGGNLSELLNGLAHTIRERQKLARKVQIISAEGRLSGNVLIALPVAMTALLTIVNPDYINVLWSTEPGKKSVFFGLTMMVIGAFIVRRIVTIKV